MCRHHTVCLTMRFSKRPIVNALACVCILPHVCSFVERVRLHLFFFSLLLLLLLLYFFIASFSALLISFVYPFPILSSPFCLYCFFSFVFVLSFSFSSNSFFSFYLGPLYNVCDSLRLTLNCLTEDSQLCRKKRYLLM